MASPERRQSRGRDVDSIINQYLETVRPMFQQFIEPSRMYADLIIPRGGKNQIAIDLIKTKISSLIDQTERMHTSGVA